MILKRELILMQYCNQKQQKIMKIDDFLLDSEPLNKLVSAYVELEQVYDKAARADNHKKETLYLNTILVSLATKKSTISALWAQIKYCLQVNSGDRDCLRRGAQLLAEVFKRNSQSLQSAPKEIVVQIIQLSCEKALITICGNDFITLIQHITSRITLASDIPSTVPIITNLIASNKLQVNTYRQETRLCLYKILLRLLDLQQESNGFLEKCVRAGEGEKDPRNIGAVFELYLKVLGIFPTEKLLNFRAAMFQNIEAYYPIQFVGDEDNQEHRKVNFQEISSLLDQCLCHPFFSELSWDLLSSKTAAPPLAPFISTLLAYFRSLRRCPNPALNVRLASLLLRFSQEEFIAEEYQEHAAQDISTVIEGILDVVFCREDGSFEVEGLVAVKKWLDLMISRVTNGECHHSGTMMGIFRAIINRCNKPRFAALVELVRSISLRAILRSLSDGEIIPKLGLAVVVVTQADKVSQDVKELIGLLVLKIGSLYTTVSDEVKLLLLKILLQIYKGSDGNRPMVRKANDGLILKDILGRAQSAFASCPNANQAYLVKAFIDFVATVHAHEIDLLLQHVGGVHFQLEAYLLGRLWENINDQEDPSGRPKIIKKLNELLKALEKDEDGQNLVKGLRVIAKPLLLKLVLSANWQRDSHSQELIFSILLNLRKDIETAQIDSAEISLQQQASQLSRLISQFFLNKNQQNLLGSKQQQLWKALSQEEGKSVTFPLMAQISKYGITSAFNEKFINAYPPTFIQWSWEQLKNSEESETRSKRLGEILRWLPEPVLLRDRKQVLGLILTDGRCASSLLKIAKHIEIDTIKSTGIVDYCLQYILSLSKEQPLNTTERSTCILATLISIAERDKGGQLKQIMKKVERALRQLRQHRKRPIRQAVRRLLSLLQE